MSIPRATLEKCIAEIVRTAPQSLAQMAAGAVIAVVLARYRVTMQYLLTRMRMIEPKLSKCMVQENKQALTAEQKVARLNYCKRMYVMLLMPMATPGLVGAGLALYWHIIYIDQKTLYIHPDATQLGWGVDDAETRQKYGGRKDRVVVKSDPHRTVSAQQN